MNTPEIESLKKLIEQGSRKAQSIGTEVLVSHTQSAESIDPLDLFTAAEPVTSDRWYWECPDQDRAFASIGILTSITPPRNIRFQEVGRYLRQYASSATVQNDSPDETVHPIFSVAFSFDPYVEQDRIVWQGFPSTCLLTPRMTLIRDGDRTSLIQNTFVGPRVSAETLVEAAREFNESIIKSLQEVKDSNLIVDELEPDKTNEQEIRQFVRAIARSESALQRGELDTLSIARRRKMTTGGLYRLNRSLKYLRGRYPQSQLVAAGRHGSTFIGIAEDFLLRKQGNSVVSSCAAGSIRRSNDADLDQALIQQLLGDPLTVEHHELCVDHLYEALEANCDDLDAPEDPDVRSTTERHHLHSIVAGTLRADTKMMELLGDLHPAVHVSGSPNGRSNEFIRNEEGTDRGWFGAPFGWVDLEGNGEFVCATNGAVVRAPVLHQQRAYVFTLTPVRSGVDPEDLIEQTNVALEPMMTALRQ